MLSKIRNTFRILALERKLKEEITEPYHRLFYSRIEFVPSLRDLAKAAFVLQKRGHRYGLSVQEECIYEEREEIHKCWACAHGDPVGCCDPDCGKSVGAEHILVGYRFHVNLAEEQHPK